MSSSLLNQLKEKSIAAAAVAKERSIAAAAVVQERSVVWKQQAAVISADVGVKAKEAYAAAKKSELYERASGAAAAVVGRKAMNEVGIYRVGGSTTEINKLKAQFNTGMDVDLFQRDAETGTETDSNAVCSVIKAFLRELPEPILTSRLAQEFQALFPGGEDPSGSVSFPPTAAAEPPPISSRVLSELKVLCTRLPRCNICTLRFFMAHLDRIQRRSSANKMSISNLAVIFTPTLQINSTLLRALILNWEVLFVIPPKTADDEWDHDSSSTSLSLKRDATVGSRGSGVDGSSSPTHSARGALSNRTMSVPPPRPPVPKSLNSSGIQRRSMGDHGFSVPDLGDESDAEAAATERRKAEETVRTQPAKLQPPMPPRPSSGRVKSMDSLDGDRGPNYWREGGPGGNLASPRASPTSANGSVGLNGMVAVAGRARPPPPPPPASRATYGSGNALVVDRVRLKGGNENDVEEARILSARTVKSSESLNVGSGSGDVKVKKIPPPPPPSKRRSQAGDLGGSAGTQ
ncbi:hypothetical protein HK101_010147 [Irineochytrium annulatum]|nr:hypothetical protein HK101_010147 [Irineochytrium annulatum]